MSQNNPAYTPICAIVGLGNIGTKYQDTRHNAGFAVVDAIAKATGAALRQERKFQGDFGQFMADGRKIFLLKPSTYMNASGRAVALLANFYQLTSAQILVAHDDLDLPEGTIKLKQGGGHGGHNGLRDITSALDAQFWRLRVGIGHPGDAKLVLNYVLGTPSRAGQQQIHHAIDDGVNQLDAILSGDFEAAMRRLHARK